MKVAFLLLHYPVFSETFVSQEILNLQKLGIKGSIYCEKKNTIPPFHPHLDDIKFPVNEISQKIFSGDLSKIIKAHFFYLLHNPLGYLQSLKIFISFFNYHHLRVFLKAPLLALDLHHFRPDLIYVHEVDSACLYGLICSRLLRLPVGIIIHTEYLFSQNQFLAFKLKLADFVIFQSQYSLDQAKSITKLPASIFHKCHVVYSPGVDTDFFAPPATKTFSPTLKIISIGRLEAQKGFVYLIKAIKILKNSYPKIICQIIGDGSLKSSLVQLIDHLKLRKNVFLLGSIPHNSTLIKLLQDSDLFVLPCTTDSRRGRDVHPNAIKEAMSTGLPVITSNIAGISEIIQDNYNGMLLPKLSVKSLANRITTFNQLPNIHKQHLSQRARITILKLHQQQLITHQLLNIFQKYA